MSDKIILEVKNLKKYFVMKKDLLGRPKKVLKAVDDISFTLKEGETIGIVGESGCGKTTMGRSVLRLNDITGGEVVFNGETVADIPARKLRKLRTEMQIIFQDPYSSLPPRMSVGQIIGEAVKVHKIVPIEELRAYVLDIMGKCGLQPHYYDRFPHEFSGGQRQRICIARALAVRPKLVVCDEPVSALDVSIQANIINLLEDLRDEMKLSYIFISHDLSVIYHVSDKIGVMYLGNLVELASKDDLFDNPLSPYTRTLFSAVPAPDPRKKMSRIILTGDIPSPANPPHGCKFHNRCPECMQICKMIRPEFYEAAPNHFVACHCYYRHYELHPYEPVSVPPSTLYVKSRKQG
jgi:peptide/nickel transport system ATP-binding protein